MNANIRPGLQALLSYLVLLSALIIFFNAIISPALNARRDKLATITNLQEQNQRFLQSIRDDELQISNAESLAATLDDSQYDEQFLRADTSALAGAQLQALLRTLIESSGAELVTAAFRRADEGTNFPRITVNLRLQSSTGALHALLLDIENHTLALFIENLVVQSRHREGRVITDINEELEVRMDITAFLDMSAGGEG